MGRKQGVKKQAEIDALKQLKKQTVLNTVRKHTLIALQALSGALIGVCFFGYLISARLTVKSLNYEESTRASFDELRLEYTESEVYRENLSRAISDVLNYAIIRSQFETTDTFDGNKNVSIGEYSAKYLKTEYNGPDATYKLADLINWGQRGFAREYKLFFDWNSYYDFFAIEHDNAVPDDSENIENPEEKSVSAVESFEIVDNLYFTVDGLKLEECVDNKNDYINLTNALEETIKDIKESYHDYLQYTSYYNEDASNIRFYLQTVQKGVEKTYTNLTVMHKGASKEAVNVKFKGFGDYMIITPSTLEYDTNTSVLCEDVIKIFDNYNDNLADSVTLWIAVDSTYPVKDVFYNNETAFLRTQRLVPWIVSLGAVAIIAFVLLFFFVYLVEKKNYTGEDAYEKLGDFDRLPIEVTFLFLVLLILVLVLGESVLIKNGSSHISENLPQMFVPISLLFAADIYIMLLFVYGFLRRAICHNLLEGSFTVMLAKPLGKLFARFKAWFWKVYDSAGVGLRTTISYVLFMLFNIFWALMFFYSRKRIVPVIVLMIFDFGVGIILYRRNNERNKIIGGIRKINSGDYDYQIDSTNMHGENKAFSEAVNNIGAAINRAVETSIKDEKMKADLITNVSHDIKTPLTSIINYIDLLKNTKLDNESAVKYISVLDEKAQRLKTLTFDLVEASKITSGNISIDYIKLNLVEFVNQTSGEFEMKFEERGLDVVISTPNKPVYILADPRHMWRVIENVLNNACKYALENTRVYLDLKLINEGGKDKAVLSLKNISKQSLNIPAEELTERFIRGDVSRSTEGSGLGLSIAKSLTTAQKGTFDIVLDGDLFKVMIGFFVTED